MFLSDTDRARIVEAIRLAKQLVDGHDVELRQLGRLVETFTVLPSADLGFGLKPKL